MNLISLLNESLDYIAMANAVIMIIYISAIFYFFRSIFMTEVKWLFGVMIFTSLYYIGLNLDWFMQYETAIPYHVNNYWSLFQNLVFSIFSLFSVYYYKYINSIHRNNLLSQMQGIKPLIDTSSDIIKKITVNVDAYNIVNRSCVVRHFKKSLKSFELLCWINIIFSISSILYIYMTSLLS